LVYRFFERKESMPDKYESGDRTYQVYRTDDATSLEDIRDGGLVNFAGYSLREIPKVLEELQQILAENPPWFSLPVARNGGEQALGSKHIARDCAQCQHCPPSKYAAESGSKTEGIRAIIMMWI
jgi:hypothetical protein